MVLITRLGGTGGGGNAGTPVQEQPAGAIDGLNRIFSLSQSPLAATLEVTLNGLRQQAGAGNDYVLVGAVLTFEPGMTPLPGDSIRAYYRY